MGGRTVSALDAGIELDRTSPVPLYFQVATQLAGSIQSGHLPPGTRLPTEVELAGALGLSRPTTRQAMDYLADQGLVVRQRGVGTRVISPKVLRSLELTSLYDDLSAGGKSPTTKVLSLDVRSASSEVAHELQLEAGAPILVVVRLRRALDQPIARLTNYLDPARVALTAQDLEAHGLYQLLRRAGVSLHSATQVIGARSATAVEARLLGTTRGAALLTTKRTASDDYGVPVEYGDHIYSATNYSFQLSLLAG